MPTTIFLLEIIIVSFMVSLYNLSESSTKEISPKQTSYNSYYAFNSQRQTTLVLQRTPCDRKLTVWQNSYLQEEMMQHFPDMHAMTGFVNQRVSDTSGFKSKLVGYMEYIHGEYVSGNLNKAQYQHAIANPDPLLPAY
ncbi:MAG TPA: hypothetical protein ENK86_04945 [Campylobacterales bacterium]|nr:hypothetical protein [Campylobacterales bacterium]